MFYIMKKYFYIVAAALGLLATASCAKEVEEDVLEVVTVSSSLVGVEGASQTISFATNNPWEISSDKNWVSFDIASGEAGEGTVTITVAANDTYDARSAKVTVSSASKSYSFTVSQAGKSEFGTEVPITVSNEEQSISIPVNSNVEYTVTVSEDAASWLSASKMVTKSEPEESTVRIKVAENLTSLERTGYVTIAAGTVTQVYAVTQEFGYEPVTKAEAIYLGSAQDPYDEETYAYNSFNEFALTLSDENGTEVVLVLTGTDKNNGTDAFPTGVFTVDAAGTHADNTFSLKPTSGYRKYYTTVIKDSEIPIYDGEISVTGGSGAYTVKAILLDGDDVRHNYKYEGAIEIADKSFGAECYNYTYCGQYNTYFAGGAQEWYVSLIASRKDNDDNPVFLRSINLTVYGSVSQTTELPTGEFTYEVPATDETLTYPCGTTKANPQTFCFSAGIGGDWVDISPEEGKTPSLIISKNEDGTYCFTFKGDFVLTRYDDATYELDPTTAVNFSYDGTFESVYLPEFETGLQPSPDDVDVVFNETFNSKYPAFYYGKAFDESNDVFYFGFTSVNNSYAVNLAVNVKGDYVFEVNYGKYYCSTPFNVGTFTYSATAGDNTLIPLKQSSAPRLYIQNSYTGSIYFITGGSITLTSSAITYNLTAKRKGGTTEVHFTGTHDASLHYVRDYTKYMDKLGLFTVE